MNYNYLTARIASFICTTRIDIIYRSAQKHVSFVCILRLLKNTDFMVIELSMMQVRSNLSSFYIGKSCHLIIETDDGVAIGIITNEEKSLSNA